MLSHRDDPLQGMAVLHPGYMLSHRDEHITGDWGIVSRMDA